MTTPLTPDDLYSVLEDQRKRIEYLERLGQPETYQEGLLETVHKMDGTGATNADNAYRYRQPHSTSIRYGNINDTNANYGGLTTNFVVVYSGYILPEFSQAYTFYCTSDDGVALWIDGTAIVPKYSAWIDQSSTEYTGTTGTLVAGVYYSVHLIHYQGAGGQRLMFEWSSSSQTREVVPSDRLYHSSHTPRSPVGTIGGKEIKHRSITEEHLVSPAGGGGIVPAGSVIFSPRSTIPTGWYLANGQAVSRTVDKPLFDAIGTTWGVGDGSTTFNVPPMEGIVPRGIWSGDARMDGFTAGGNADLTLTTTNMPAHSHTVNSHTHDGGTYVAASHTHDSGSYGTDTFAAHAHNALAKHAAGSNSSALARGDSAAAQTTLTDVTNAVGSHSHDVAGSSGSAAPAVSGSSGSASPGSGSQGSGGSFNNMSWYITGHWLIRR
jgi:microcystin-dependent protein